MTPFKVGDRVRLVSENARARFMPPVGTVSTVTNVYRNTYSSTGWSVETDVGFSGHSNRFVPEPTLLTLSKDRRAVLEAVLAERDGQDAKFGEFGGMDEKSPFEALAVLTEEVGELAQAINDGDLRHAHEELVQCAAVCIAMLEAAEACPPKGTL